MSINKYYKLSKESLHRSSIRNFSIYYLIIAGILSTLIYWPSINGPFLFDDVYNLIALGKNGGINSFADWKDFVFGGVSSRLGRPLVLASFTLNSLNWPTDPLPFKVTNIAIHLLNSWLVFKLLTKISAIYNRGRKIKLAPILPALGALIWLLHPIHLTTILQIVQRMTLLSGTFTFISLIMYTNYIARNKLKFDKAFVKLVLFLSVIGLFGILSKETAILIPFYLFSLNYTVFRRELSKTPYFSIAWQRFLLFGTLLILLLIFTILNRDFSNSWLIRDFNLEERLYTESRILFDYIEKLFIPKASGFGLFHDDIVISRGLLTPISTIFSLIAIFILIIIAILLRKSKPFISLAILWFFLGHILESTAWPLELYFEHRNYAPSISAIFLIFQVFIELKNKSIRIFFPFASAYLVLVTTVTSLNTPIWGNSLELFNNWALEKPNSLRAQHQAASTWLNEYHNPSEARKFLLRAHQINPKHIGTRMLLLKVNCFYSEPVDDILALTQNLETYEADSIYIKTIASIVKMKENKLCPNLSSNFIINFLTKLEENTNLVNDSYYGWLLYNKVRVLLINENLDDALIYAHKSLKETRYLGTVVLMIEIAYKMDDLELARKYFKEAKLLEKQGLIVISEEMKAKYTKFSNLL